MGIFRRKKAEPPTPTEPNRVVQAVPVSKHDDIDSAWFGARALDSGDIQVRWESPAQAKKCIADLRLMKAKLRLAKKAIVEEERQIHAAYTDGARHRTPAIRGGGKIGGFARSVQVAKHAGDRRTLANRLAPLEQRRATLERQALQIEAGILQVQSKVLEQR